MGIWMVAVVFVGVVILFNLKCSRVFDSGLPTTCLTSRCSNRVQALCHHRLRFDAHFRASAARCSSPDRRLSRELPVYLHCVFTRSLDCVERCGWLHRGPGRHARPFSAVRNAARSPSSGLRCSPQQQGRMRCASNRFNICIRSSLPSCVHSPARTLCIWRRQCS